MKNRYGVEGESAWIKIEVPSWYRRKRSELPRFLKTWVDTNDLAKLIHEYGGTWYAAPAQGKNYFNKFYAVGKLWNRDLKKCRTVMLHRLLMGEPACDVHHGDGDGLNNRRGNLYVLTHQENVRLRWPEKDWRAHDYETKRVMIFKRFVAIGNEVSTALGLTRQAVWKIRTGSTRSGATYEEFWRRVREAFPALFPPQEQRHPWIVMRQFAIPKPAKRLRANGKA